MENFFFISLGITFALILLLVYHFKQRISSVERRGDTMFELLTNVVKELQFMKSLNSYYESIFQKSTEGEVVQPESKPVPEIDVCLFRPPTQTPQLSPEENKVIDLWTVESPDIYVSKIPVSDDSESEWSESDTEPGSDLEEESGSEDDSDESDDEPEKINIHLGHDVVSDVISEVLDSVVEYATMENIAVDSLTVDSLPVDSLPIENLTVDSLPIENLTVDSLPVDSLPVDSLPVDSLPVDSLPVDSLPVDSLPVDSLPVDSLPVDSLPVENLTVDSLPIKINERSAETQQEVPLTPEQEFAEPTKEQKREIYRKMNITQLRAMATAAGIKADMSKLKKLEIIRLLENLDE